MATPFVHNQTTQKHISLEVRINISSFTLPSPFPKIFVSYESKRDACNVLKDTETFFLFIDMHIHGIFNNGFFTFMRYLCLFILFPPSVIFCNGIRPKVEVGFLLCRDHSAFTYAIKRSCENKAEVVSLDEKESGLRATLNLGHTFGHVRFSTHDTTFTSILNMFLDSNFGVYI